jgi:hypothetical protein
MIGLTEKEIDEFRDFLNVNEEFLKTVSEMELITFIQDNFDLFKLMKR